MNEFLVWLASRCRSLNTTRFRVAREAGLDRAMFYRRSPRHRLLRRTLTPSLASALGVSHEELLCRAGYVPAPRELLAELSQGLVPELTDALVSLLDLDSEDLPLGIAALRGAMAGVRGSR